MDDEIEAVVREHLEVRHVTEDSRNGKAVPLGHLRIAVELPWGIVEDGHGGSCGGKDRRLLSSSRCQAKDVAALDLDPRSRNGFGRREHNLPPPLARRLYCLGRHRYGPFIALLDKRIPGDAVVLANVPLVPLISMPAMQPCRRNRRW